MPAATSNDEKYKEIKSILRSLVIAQGQRTPVRKLNFLYREVEDRNIPFRDFNYTNMIEFLQSMPDTLRLIPGPDDMLVQHVETEKSAHISSLIARQRKPAHKSKIRHHTYNKPRPPYNNYYSRPVQFPPRPSFPPRNVLSEVLEALKTSPFRSKTNAGIRKADVLSKVRERLGANAAFYMTDLNSQLSKLSHLLVVEDDCIYFKDELQRNRMSNTRLDPPRPANPPRTEPTQRPASPPKLLDLPKLPNPKMQGQIVIDDFNVPANEEKIINTDQKNARSAGAIPEEEKPLCDLINERTKIRLKKLIEKHPEGIWCSELPDAYKRDYNIVLEYYDYGFSNIIEFVAALPDIFSIVVPPNSNRQMVVDATKPTGNFENVQKKTLASVYNFDDYIKSDPNPVPIRLVRESLVSSSSSSIPQVVRYIILILQLLFTVTRSIACIGAQSRGESR